MRTRRAAGTRLCAIAMASVFSAACAARPSGPATVALPRATPRVNPQPWARSFAARIGEALTERARMAPSAPRRAYTFRAGRRVRYAIESTQSARPGATPFTVRSWLRVETLRTEADGSALERITLDVQQPDRALRRAIRDGLAPSLSVEPEARVARDALGAVQAREGSDALAQSAVFLAPAFPPDGAAVGAHWHDEQRYAMALGRGMSFSFVAHRTHTLRAVEPSPAGEILVVGVALRLRLEPGSQVSGMPVEAEGEAEGEVTLVPSRAIVVASTLRGAVLLRARANPETIEVPLRFGEEVRLVGEEG